MDIKALGPRICIIGLSNSGKSTLAQFIGRQANIKVIHLDQLAHVPGTHWQRRDNAAFAADHDIEIQNDAWVIEGNYSVCMPQRFKSATSVIWLDLPPMGCTVRYIFRCLKNDKNRSGGLQDAQSEFNLALIKYTWQSYPKNKIKYQALISDFDGHVIKIQSMRALNIFIKSLKSGTGHGL